MRWQRTPRCSRSPYWAGVPDTMMGEKVGAVVVLKPRQRADAKEILDFAARLLADFKVPQFLVVRGDPLPRNPGSKILKKRLRGETDWGEPLR
jgi:long-chain acyl-CoA synthetase